jgi:Mg-chelatase subunit ChlD
MAPTSKRRGARAADRGELAASLHRAAAKHGALDAIYQDLSDHWTRIFQQLFPVWVVLGPRLAEPGHIDLASRTIYLDSDELLGSRDEILSGLLQGIRIATTMGVGFHETFHAKHTKMWVAAHDVLLTDSEDEAERQLAVDRRLLEEPRMEATGCRAFPPETRRGRFVRTSLRAAVLNVILPRFVEQLMQTAAVGQPVPRDMVGRAMSYMQARTHYGILRPADLSALRRIWEQVLGPVDFRALDDLYAEVIWIADGDNDRLSEVARAYRDIIGPPDQPPSRTGAESVAGAPASAAAGTDAAPAQDGPAGRPGGRPGSTTAEDAVPTVEALEEALDDAVERARESQLQQLNVDVDLAETMRAAAAGHLEAPPTGGGGTGAPTGRMPDRGVDRPPASDERTRAQQFTMELRRARTIAHRSYAQRTPGGRFNGRAYARACAQRFHRQPVTSHPWSVTRDIVSTLDEPHLLLVVDTSGSMAQYEYALGPIVWIVTAGVAGVGGRVASVAFGNGVELIDDGAQPMRKVPGIQTGGGTAFAGDAIVEGCELLDMHNRRRPRAIYIISDGGWYDTEAGLAQIHLMREHGVPTVHIGLGMAPLSIDADRVSVIEDPAGSLDIIAADTVAAMKSSRQLTAVS